MSAQVMAVTDRVSAGLRSQVLRQLNHWEGAAERLDDFEATASPEAWATLERYVGVTLRGGLKQARDQLKREAAAVRASFNAARSRSELERVADQVALLRKRYLQTELLVDFYVAAVRARANPEVGLQLRACDVMADRVVRGALEPLTMKVPPIMTYFTTGVGASILRIGTKLWDGSLSPIAAIRLTYHNRFRTTSLFHECGHQVAGITGWNEAFAADHPQATGREAADDIAETVASWASEIAADSFAFAYSGYAAVVALSDVVAGRGPEVFRFLYGDPHPISYLRVLLGVEMCRRFYGMGPWDELATAWQQLYPIPGTPHFSGAMVARQFCRSCHGSSTRRCSRLCPVSGRRVWLSWLTRSALHLPRSARWSAKQAVRLSPPAIGSGMNAFDLRRSPDCDTRPNRRKGATSSSNRRIG